jgi:hypothetical protein
MKNLIDVLKQKVHELERLQQEVEALQTALRLCAENDSETQVVELRPLKMAAGAEADTPGFIPKSARQFP